MGGRGSLTPDRCSCRVRSFGLDNVRIQARDRSLPVDGYRSGLARGQSFSDVRQDLRSPVPSPETVGLICAMLGNNRQPEQGPRMRTAQDDMGTLDVGAKLVADLGSLGSGDDNAVAFGGGGVWFVAWMLGYCQGVRS